MALYKYVYYYYYDSLHDVLCNTAEPIARRWDREHLSARVVPAMRPGALESRAVCCVGCSVRSSSRSSRCSAGTCTANAAGCKCCRCVRRLFTHFCTGISLRAAAEPWQIYRVGQESKLLMLSEYVNKTEKMGETWTNKSSYGESEVLSDIFTRNILRQNWFIFKYSVTGSSQWNYY